MGNGTEQMICKFVGWAHKSRMFVYCSPLSKAAVYKRWESIKALIELPASL
jgi:hypothetical protein